VPHHAHPIFHTGSGSAATTLQDQAAILFNAVHSATQALTHKQTGANHKQIESIFAANDRCRRNYVEKQEKTIKFGEGVPWADAEADEVDLRGDLVDDHDQASDEKVQWGAVGWHCRA
jgi:hypothetical protein